LGLGAMGWFFVIHPQPNATVKSKGTGHYVLEAAAGPGYQFRWHSEDPEKPDQENWTGKRWVEVDVPEGQTKVVKLEVKNAFDRTATTTLVVGTPRAPEVAKPTAGLPPGGARKAGGVQ